MHGNIERNPQHYRLIETRLQTRLDHNTTRCQLCLWRCKLGHGQRGFCQAHVNRHGTLYNLSYGIISAIDIGPIEAKPVRHFRPGTRAMSVGSFGCNFRCQGCHNLEISWGVSALDALARGQSAQVYVTPHELVEAALHHGVEGIAFTFSEPAVWLEYVLDVSRIAKAAGLYTVYVSNSFVTEEALELMAPWVDVLCSDIKSLDAGFYKDLCAVADVNAIMASIAHAQELGIHVETRTNIIPGKNDNLELLRVDRLGVDSPWHITRFFPAYELSHLPETSSETLALAREIGTAAGLKNVYIYGDTGCDCARDNMPVAAYLDKDKAALEAIKKCDQDCCGDEGVLLKRYEQG